MRRGVSVVLTAVVLMGILGCNRKPAMVTMLGITAGDRQVKAVIDGPASITSNGTNAVITAGEHQIVVEPERVLLDGKEQTNIPADAKHVEVQYKAGQLTTTVGESSPE